MTKRQFTYEERMEIMDTMIQQLGGEGKLRAMLGIEHFMSHSESAMSFHFKGSSKINLYILTLNDKDLYDIEYCKFHRKANRVETVVEVKDVYAENLKSHFEETTGLYLSL